jgi:hypothetical protein
MNINKIIIGLFLSVSFSVLSQHHLDTVHVPSKYYKEMFPGNVDEQKLLVVLPKVLTKQEVDSLLKGHSESELQLIYDEHVASTNKAIKNIEEYVKLNNIDCEVVSKEKYSVDSFPVSKYPFIIYPDSMVMNHHFAVFGYHLKDVQNNKNYGYVMGDDADFHYKYFKQLSKYISKLKLKKSHLAKEPNASYIAETKIYKTQKRNKVWLNYVAMPVGFVLSIVAILIVVV